MPPIFLSTLDDPRLTPYRHLKQTNLTRWSNLFVCEGDKLVQRLIDSVYEVDSILVARPLADGFASQGNPETPVYIVDDELIEQIVGFNFHRGALACGRRKPPLSAEQFFAAFDGQAIDRSLTLVICDGVQNPENLGAILRISAGFGVDAVMLGPGCADPFSRRVLRVSMGATLRMPLIASEYLSQDIVDLYQRSQVKLFATTLSDRAEDVRQIAPQRRQAIVFGGEGHGISPEVLAVCQRHVTIPMAPDVDSLNVAVAAGIMLYHFAAAVPTQRGP